MLFGSVSKKHVLHRDVSGSDLEKVVKSRSRILNEGLVVSAGLGFYHSIPLKMFVSRAHNITHVNAPYSAVTGFLVGYDIILID